jgi:NADH dehydrogenase
VNDLARVVADVLERPAAVGMTYGVGGPEVVTFRQLVQTFALAATGRGKATVSVPVTLAKLVVPIVERVLPNPPITRGELKMLLEGSTADNGPLVRDLGFDPRGLADTVAEYLDAGG